MRGDFQGEVKDSTTKGTGYAPREPSLNFKFLCNGVLV
mgnify:CR=1 FL=1